MADLTVGDGLTDAIVEFWTHSPVPVIAQMAKELLALGAEQWVAVTERLPDEYERVLMASNDEIVAIGRMVQSPAQFAKGDEPFYGTWCREASRDFMEDGYDDIFWPTHWKPLPAIPQPTSEKG